MDTKFLVKFMVKGLPKSLMTDVYWAFNRGVFESEETFNEAVRQYQINIKKKDDWNSQKEVFQQPSIQIYYDYWSADGENEIEEIFELKAGNDKSFTQGKLLFKINNLVAENVSRGDHIFFEGLTLSEEFYQDKPFYRMSLGS